jgi:hypothetical protein
MLVLLNKFIRFFKKTLKNDLRPPINIVPTIFYFKKGDVMANDFNLEKERVGVLSHLWSLLKARVNKKTRTNGVSDVCPYCGSQIDHSCCYDTEAETGKNVSYERKICDKCGGGCFYTIEIDNKVTNCKCCNC